MNSNLKNQKDLLAVLKKKVLLCDGAMGTMLQSYGLQGSTDLLNLIPEAVDTIKDIHFQYIEAGADIIITNSLGSNPLKLEQLGKTSELEEINRQAVLSVKDAIDRFREKTNDNKDIYIAGDVGTSGRLLEPYGDTKFSDIVDSYKLQISSLLKNGVDFILIETIIDLNEAVAAIEAVKAVDSGIPVACTMSFRDNGVTVMGNKAEDFGSRLLEAGCDIIGANCSVGSDTMISITEKIRKANPDARLLIQPNAGLPSVVDGITVFNETPEMMVNNFRKILQFSPAIIGTCCGSTPDHTRKISELLHGS